MDKEPFKLPQLSTGWARPVAEQRKIETPMPTPDAPSLAWFVREPFPSVATGRALDFGQIGAGETLTITSEMGEGGTVFADGIENDSVEFGDGQTVTIAIADRRVRLVAPRD